MVEEGLTLPPSSLEAERAVLGSALITPEAARWVKQNLEADAFYVERHRSILAGITEVMEAGMDADIVTVAEWLRHHKLLGDVGGPQYLQECQNTVATAAHIEHYGRIVKGLYLERLILRDSYNLRDPDKRDAAMEALATHYRSKDMLDARGGMTIKEGVHRVIDGLESGPADLMNLGLSSLDAIIGGMEGGDLLTLGARTGSGKTATLLSVAIAVAKTGKIVAYFAGEMGGEQVTKRALAAESGVPHWMIRQRKFKKDLWSDITSAAARLADLPLHFCTIPSPSLKDITAFSDNVRADVVIVDYLTRCDLPRAESMRVSVTKFMVGIKNFARTTDRRVLLAAQINRATDRVEAPPKLADLRESGAIEDESDFAVLLYMSPEAKLADGTVPVQAAVAKSRHGRVGAADLVFEKETMRIHGDISSLPPRRQTRPEELPDPRFPD